MGFGESLELVRPADPIAVWGWEWPNHLAGMDGNRTRCSLTADQRTWSGRHAADFELKVKM